MSEVGCFFWVWLFEPCWGYGGKAIHFMANPTEETQCSADKRLLFPAGERVPLSPSCLPRSDFCLAELGSFQSASNILSEIWDCSETLRSVSTRLGFVLQGE